MKREPYKIIVSDEAIEHLAELEAGERSTVFSALVEQLRYEPTTATRNRKPMDPERDFYVAPWELRVGSLRVYYGVREADRAVDVAAVGRKVRERIKIGGVWIEP